MSLTKKTADIRDQQNKSVIRLWFTLNKDKLQWYVSFYDFFKPRNFRNLEITDIAFGTKHYHFNVCLNSYFVINKSLIHFEFPKNTSLAAPGALAENGKWA